VVVACSKFEVKKDYSILGNKTNKVFNAMVVLSFIGFAFNATILLELPII